MLNFIRQNVTIELDTFWRAPRVFWGISRTSAHIGMRVWGQRHLYIGLGDAS